jgi:hypothetical protein
MMTPPENAPKMAMEARVIKNAASGLQKIVDATKFAINNESRVKDSPS